MKILPISATSLFISLLSIPAAIAGADAALYPGTIAALQERYTDEVIAHRKYGTYARHAFDEGYPAIAHLFKTLAASEAMHARNFGRLLRDLGREPALPSLEVELRSTREHLRQAATVEADEIDNQYPAILERIGKEQHEEAIRFITYAWKAEQQHRDLILKIKKGASWFFGTLVRKIEGSPTRYHVCQVCGSTVTDLPRDHCPICNHPPKRYREIAQFTDDVAPEAASPAAPSD